MRRTWRQLGVVGVTALVFGAVALGAAADILFIEDFENDINPDIWNAPNTWSVVDPGAVAGLGAGVLDITGGEVGLTNRSDFGDFVLEADFKAGPETKITGFVLRAQNADNDFYMHQISTDGSGHTPNNVRWHWKVGGTWNVEPIPFEGGAIIPPDVWYHARFIVTGADFEVYVVPKADEGVADMALLGSWTDDKNGGDPFYNEGAIGFRSSGSEDMQFDNVIIADSLADITTTVDPRGKLASTWGALKFDR